MHRILPADFRRADLALHDSDKSLPLF